MFVVEVITFRVLRDEDANPNTLLFYALIHSPIIQRIRRYHIVNIRKSCLNF